MIATYVLGPRALAELDHTDEDYCCVFILDNFCICLGPPAHSKHSKENKTQIVCILGEMLIQKPEQLLKSARSRVCPQLL